MLWVTILQPLNSGLNFPEFFLNLEDLVILQIQILLQFNKIAILRSIKVVTYVLKSSHDFSFAKDIPEMMFILELHISVK